MKPEMESMRKGTKPFILPFVQEKPYEFIPSGGSIKTTFKKPYSFRVGFSYICPRVF